MRRDLAILAVLLAAGCDPAPDDTGGPVDPGACGAGDPALEVSHYGTFDALGTTMYCGIPPQGGAPYAPFGVRVRGVDPADDGALSVTITARDVDTGEELGAGDFHERFLCANAGDSAGWWVASEFHLRFFGYSLDDLHGRSATVHFVAEGANGEAERTLPFDLDCVPGD